MCQEKKKLKKAGCQLSKHATAAVIKFALLQHQQRIGLMHLILLWPSAPMKQPGRSLQCLPEGTCNLADMPCSTSESALDQSWNRGWSSQQHPAGPSSRHSLPQCHWRARACACANIKQVAYSRLVSYLLKLNIVPSFHVCIVCDRLNDVCADLVIMDRYNIKYNHIKSERCQQTDLAFPKPYSTIYRLSWWASPSGVHQPWS